MLVLAWLPIILRCAELQVDYTESIFPAFPKAQSLLRIYFPTSSRRLLSLSFACDSNFRPEWTHAASIQYHRPARKRRLEPIDGSNRPCTAARKRQPHLKSHRLPSGETSPSSVDSVSGIQSRCGSLFSLCLTLASVCRERRCARVPHLDLPPHPRFLNRRQYRSQTQSDSIVLLPKKKIWNLRSLRNP